MISRLKVGVDLNDAQKRLREVASSARAIAIATAGADFNIYRNQFLQWVDKAEGQLRGIFTSPEVWERLYDERYWQIWNLTDVRSRAIELISYGADAQASRLEELADDLAKFSRRLAAAPGQLTVLDTNVLLHFFPPQQINWQEIIHSSKVRLVLPLRVIEELDQKKYTARDNLASRARSLLSQLRTTLSATGGDPVQLRENVTIEVPVDDGPRRRGIDADQEILDYCLELRAVGKPPVLVTDDTGLTIRAQALGLTVAPMPDRYLRKKPDAETSKESAEGVV